MNDNVVGLLIAGAIVSAAFGALLVCLMVFWDGFRLGSLDEREDDTRQRRSTLRRGHGAAALAFVLTGVFVTAAGAGLSLREPPDGEPRVGGGDGALLRRLIARAALLADRVDAFVRETPLRGAEENFMVSERRLQARGRGAAGVSGVPGPSEAPPAATPSPGPPAAAPPTAVDGRAAVGAVPPGPASIERMPPTQPIRVRRSGPGDTGDRRAATVRAPVSRVESGVEAARPVVLATPPADVHRPEPAKVEIPEPAKVEIPDPAPSVAAPTDVWAPPDPRGLEPRRREIKREPVSPEPTDVPRAEPPEGDRAKRNEPGERRTPREREQRSDGIDKGGREKTERSAKVDRRDKADRPGKVERADRERPEKLDRREKVERPDKLERREKVERPEKIERRERVERPERVQKIEKVERPERRERVEKVERPEGRRR